MTTKKVRWVAVEVIGQYRVYARPGRGEIIMRVEKDGDTTKYAEWGMPKLLGLAASMAQAAIQTKLEDLRP